jgi:hypothetical protein
MFKFAVNNSVDANKQIMNLMFVGPCIVNQGQ